MTLKIPDEDLNNFYSRLYNENYIKLLFSMILSLSFYIYVWIYRRNKAFIEVDSMAPDADRGIAVLVILPAIWFLIMYFLKKYFAGVPEDFLLQVYWIRNLADMNIHNVVIGSIETLMWLFIVFLIIKYLYDFSYSFARVTKSNGFLWYLLLLPQPFGFIFLVFGTYSLWFFVFFTIGTVMLMEARMIWISRKVYQEYQRKMYFRTSNSSGSNDNFG